MFPRIRPQTAKNCPDVNLWALALGSLTRGVTVRAMTAAYATFANEGVWREARTYTVVKDSNGQVILDNTQESHVAMKDMTAWYITDMLEIDCREGHRHGGAVGEHDRRRQDRHDLA